ncbi:hypothetical protein pipiens_014675 [Culex pipiens pipiens]|uniref:Vacuolar ATPase assembly integral membrane protein VMA21 homolog n=2 Tax=Culex pipiens TaxID=7175 RepID=A0A8D8IJ22_CULPI
MSKSKNKQQVSKNEQRNEYRNFRVVFFYCILIILLPVSTFFATKYVLFDGYFQLSSVSSNIYAAVAAVIALHIALGLYIYRAYFDSGPSDQSTKLAQKQD